MSLDQTRPRFALIETDPVETSVPELERWIEEGLRLIDQVDHTADRKAAVLRSALLAQVECKRRALERLRS